LTCSIRISMNDTLIKILYTLNKCLAYPMYNSYIVLYQRSYASGEVAYDDLASDDVSSGVLFFRSVFFRRISFRCFKLQ